MNINMNESKRSEQVENHGERSMLESNYEELF